MPAARRRATAVAAGLSLLAAACGSSASTHPPAPTHPPVTARPPATTGSSTTSRGAPPAPGDQAAAGEWTTYHHDPARSGVDPSAPPAGNVARAWTAALDGAVYAEPLVAGGTVIAATENDTVYALDARTGTVRWSTHLGTPVPGSSLPCGNIDPSGITGTPVIDPATATVWVLAFESRPGQGPAHRLVGIALRTGKVTSDRPADAPGSDPAVEQQRGALLLDTGNVYVPYGGLYGDCGAYHGEVVSLPANGAGGPAAWVVPTTREGGIWAPPGPVNGPGGRILVTTGNSASQTVYDYANAVVALTPDLRPVDLFAPSDWRQLSAEDQDLSSTSPTVLASGQVLAAGKDGVAYLLDGTHLGGVGHPLARLDACSGGAWGGTAVSGTAVYLPCRNGLAAVDTAGGRLAPSWTLSLADPGAPVVAGGEVWDLARDGTLVGVDEASGRVRQRLSLPAGSTSFPTLGAAGGRLYAPTGSSVTAVGGI